MLIYHTYGVFMIVVARQISTEKGVHDHFARKISLENTTILFMALMDVALHMSTYLSRDNDHEHTITRIAIKIHT